MSVVAMCTVTEKSSSNRTATCPASWDETDAVTTMTSVRFHRSASAPPCT